MASITRRMAMRMIWEDLTQIVAFGVKSRFKALNLVEMIRLDFVNPHSIDHSMSFGQVDECPSADIKK
jgi:hypothetical protein